jgi:hypothetical protein
VKCIDETKGRDDLIRAPEGKFNYVISHVASERATDIMNEMELC